MENQNQTTNFSDLKLARNYIGKADNARSRGIEFSLSFTAYKNLMRAKKCQVTGTILTDPRPQKDLLATDRTIDRIDSKKGYVSGNVMAVCHAVNGFKSFFENGNHNKIITPEIGMKILGKMVDKTGEAGRVVKVKTSNVNDPIPN